VASPKNLSKTRAKRHDIQALRALAVIAVVAYHADLPVAGGFLGVDIFFVISGYVIAALLLREFASTGRIDLKRFYSRRIRRLLPAVLVLVTVVLVLSVAVFPVFSPLQTSLLTGIAGIFSVANIVIDRTTFDYFAAPAKENLFLHLWSLSVEEQFYLIFPALLVLLLARTGIGRRAFLALLGTVVLSFGLAVFGSSELRAILPFGQSVVGFYSPVTRAWEFGIGAAIAFLPPRKLSDTKRRTLVGIGISFVVMGVFFLSDDFRTPGLSTALPVAGTALIILAGSQNSGNAPKWVLFLGDVSYSWYLWHWPAITLGKIVWPAEEWLIPVLALGSLAPATASYFLIERPLRYGKVSGERVNFRVIPAMAIAPIAISIAVPAVYGLTIEANSNRYQLSGDFEQDEYYARLAALSFDCRGIPECVVTAPNQSPTVVILGDSHGAHFFVGLAEQLQQENVAWLKDSAEIYQSLDTPRDRLESILRYNTVHTLVIGEYWSNPSRDSMPEALEALVLTAEQSDVSVVIPNGTPYINFPVFRCKWGLAINPEDKACEFNSRPTLETASQYLDSLEQLDSKFRHVLVVPTLEVFCGDELCRVGDQDAIFFRDSNHLGIYGSRQAAPPIIDAIESLQQNSR